MRKFGDLGSNCLKDGNDNFCWGKIGGIDDGNAVVAPNVIEGDAVNFSVSLLVELVTAVNYGLCFGDDCLISLGS